MKLPGWKCRFIMALVQHILWTLPCRTHITMAHFTNSSDWIYTGMIDNCGDDMHTLVGRRFRSRIIYPIGVFLTLGLAYLLDSWLFTQTRLAKSTHLVGIYDPLFLWTIISGLVLFAAWLALSWLALTKSSRSLPISLTLIVIGLIFYIYPYLEILITWLPMLYFTVRTPLAYTGLFIAVLSTLQLILKYPNSSLDKI